MNSLRPQRDWAGVIGPWLAIVVVVLGVVVRFVQLEEAKMIAVERDVVQDRLIEKHDDYIRALQTDRALESQISAMTAEIAALKVQVSGMRDELKPKRGR